VRRAGGSRDEEARAEGGGRRRRPSPGLLAPEGTRPRAAALGFEGWRRWVSSIARTGGEMRSGKTRGCFPRGAQGYIR
jgi:hypothetical protein